MSILNDRYRFTFTRHYLNPIASLSCLNSSVDLQVRSEMFADLYHLTLRNHPSITWQIHLAMEAFLHAPFSPLDDPSHRALLSLSGYFGINFSLFFPTASFAGRGSQMNLRGTHHRVISSHLMPSVCAVSHQLVGGRRSSRDRYISMLNPTWIHADQLSSSVWRYLHSFGCHYSV